MAQGLRPQTLCPEWGPHRFGPLSEAVVFVVRVVG